MRELLQILRDTFGPCKICHSWWCSTGYHCPDCHQIRVKFQGCLCEHRAEFRRILARAEQKVFAEEAERVRREQELDLLADKVWERIQAKHGGPS